MTGVTNLNAAVTGVTDTSSVESKKDLDATSDDEGVQEMKRMSFVEKMLPKWRTGVAEFVFPTSSFSLMLTCIHSSILRHAHPPFLTPEPM